MLKYVALTLAFASSIAIAKEKCNTKFENPIKDDRIHFTSCAISGALIGIIDGDYGDVLCLGSLKTDDSRKLYAFKGEKSSKIVYYEQTSSELTAGAGESDGGIRISKIKLKTVTPKLDKPKKQRQTTLTFTETWEYSEGSAELTGRLPGARQKFSAQVYFLGESLDHELEQFASEICD